MQLQVAYSGCPGVVRYQKICLIPICEEWLRLAKNMVNTQFKSKDELASTRNGLKEGKMNFRERILRTFQKKK